jgi:hypothetical protein
MKQAFEEFHGIRRGNNEKEFRRVSKPNSSDYYLLLLLLLQKESGIIYPASLVLDRSGETLRWGHFAGA